MHPDSAFSRDYYVRPEGVPDEACHHAGQRMGIGPMDRRYSMMTVDRCWHCSRVLRSARDLTWPQYLWVRDWNSHAECD